MEKLELKHLAPYLPYRLKIIDNTYRQFNCDGYSKYNKKLFLSKGGERPKPKSLLYCKPILRPLSDLTKEIEVNGEKFVPIDIMTEYSDIDYIHTNNLSFINNEDKTYFDDIWSNHISKLFEWHFDVFGLIGKGLAIDINTLR